MGELVDLAVELEIIKKSGAWYAYEGEKISQCRENAKDYLETHADMAKDIEVKVRQAYHLI